jgi:hypothetical protein
MNVSVLIPSRHRVLKLRRTIESVFATAAVPEYVECVVRIDRDDIKSIESILTLTPLGKCSFIIGEPRGYSGQATYLWEMSHVARGRWLFAINDDVVVTGKGWDTKIMEYPIFGQVVVPEIDRLGGSTYRNNPSCDFYFVPNNWWLTCGISEFSEDEQTARLVETQLREHGWRIVFMPGCETWHDRNENDSLMIENRKAVK